MRRGAKFIIYSVVALAVLAAGAIALYVFVIQDDPPPRVALSSTTTTGGTGTAPASADGTWTVQQGESTFLGYRVNEKLASLPSPSDAVGRTPAVEGTMTIAGSTVSAADVTGDLSQLESDQDRRDSRIRTSGLESDTFPEATFTLTGPLDLGEVPEVGAEVNATASGDLTLHGVTKAVEVPLEARWSGETIEVIGTLDIVFADYDIDPPNIGGFVTVEDEGEMELQLTFVPA